MWTWMQFPLPKFLEEKIYLIKKLHECDYCSGVWGYSILAFFMQLDLLSVIGFHYVPLLSEFVTGVIISFLVHIFILGWKARFEVIVV